MMKNREFGNHAQQPLRGVFSGKRPSLRSPLPAAVEQEQGNEGPLPKRGSLTSQVFLATGGENLNLPGKYNPSWTRSREKVLVRPAAGWYWAHRSQI